MSAGVSGGRLVFAEVACGLLFLLSFLGALLGLLGVLFPQQTKRMMRKFGLATGILFCLGGVAALLLGRGAMAASFASWLIIGVVLIVQTLDLDPGLRMRSAGMLLILVGLGFGLSQWVWALGSAGIGFDMIAGSVITFGLALHLGGRTGWLLPLVETERSGMPQGRLRKFGGES